MTEATREFPNGRIVAFYGDAKGCRKQVMDGLDWKAAIAIEPDKWSLGPQSAVIMDGSPQRTAPGGSYPGFYGNS